MFDFRDGIPDRDGPTQSVQAQLPHPVPFLRQIGRRFANTRAKPGETAALPSEAMTRYGNAAPS